MRILIFTGAGISQPSGIATFRGEGGLWGEYKVNDVCSVKALYETPQVVNNFYHERWLDDQKATPNAAHIAIAKLEKMGHEVLVVTQNVDSLHERAGSTRVIHLHGKLSEVLVDGQWVERTLENSMKSSRPGIVLFGEELAMIDFAYDSISDLAPEQVWVIGSSMKVAPANLLPRLAKSLAKKDKRDIMFVVADVGDCEDILHMAKLAPRSTRETALLLQGSAEETIPKLVSSFVGL